MAFPPHQCPTVKPVPRTWARLEHRVDTWHGELVTHAGVLLVARRHVDLRRVASALCRTFR
ncbi:putative leader peptide [Amycolatopsis cynarae]|uniref:putative leader peptide n=1 Tax=Amycolatopsis cynarae TaxID=2995223 RepID=UPI003898EBFF